MTNKGRILDIGLIFLFFLLVLLPIIFINYDNSKVLVSENRKTTPFPVFSDSITGDLNNHFYTDFESWLNDNIGFRDEFTGLRSGILYHVLNTSSHGSVHIGRDGWLFFTGENNFKIATGTYPLDDTDFRRIATAQQNLNDELQAKGIAYFSAFAPSKCSIYPEYISDKFKMKDTPIDNLCNYITSNTDIITINFKHSLLPYKDSIQLYYKTDTHWNDVGYHFAYRQLLDTLRNYGFAQNELIFFRDTAMHDGDLSMMLKQNLKEEYARINIVSPRAQVLDNSDLRRVTDSVYGDQKFYRSPLCFVTKTNIKDGKRLLLFGDSFIGLTMSYLIREHFSECYFVWCKQPTMAVIDYVKPDIVISERGERFLNLLYRE